MPDRRLSDVIEITETYTGCLRGSDGKFHATILRPREGVFLAKRRFLDPGTSLMFAESCLLVPVPHNSSWVRVRHETWWKGEQQ
jgi:hypothetical protein